MNNNASHLRNILLIMNYRGYELCTFWPMLEMMRGFSYCIQA